MSFQDDVQKTMDEESPFFKAIVLKKYVFQFVGYRMLTPEDKLFSEKQTNYEFTLLDLDTGKEKMWTTGAVSVLQQMITKGIQENDIFSVVKTGETGKGKKYWEINKVEQEK